MELRQLYQQVMELFNQFNPAKDLHLMQQLSNSYLTETQFAQIVGRMRLYQAIPQGLSRRIPRLLITDSQINNVCRGYYQNEDFGGQGGAISMWNFHNLLTESNKSSYIDTYLSRAVNLYMQKEQLTLLDGEGKPTMFAPIMIATLSTCTQLERENIKFRLNSGRKLYIERGGKLGRKVGSIKTTEQKREEHKDIISYLKRGYSVRNVAKLCSKGISTVQRIKTEFEI